jgi:hypothetical protein
VKAEGLKLRVIFEGAAWQCFAEQKKGARQAKKPFSLQPKHPKT